jgi:hypothetical protein
MVWVSFKKELKYRFFILHMILPRAFQAVI